jgi:SAM-dependent methyltransferase
MNPQQSRACRSCDQTGLVSILNLGRTPLANALLTAKQVDQAEEKFPLELFSCPNCTLVQITETVSPEKLFREYIYLSSFSDTMLRHAASVAGELIATRNLDAGSMVVEVASNDGYLLQYYKAAGIPVLGIEPAENIAHIAREKHGINTISEFFGAALARKLAAEGQRADVIHANNVLAHVASLNGFVGGLALLLKDSGIAVIEVPYVKEMIDNTEFDTIYHEHLCYFSLTALDHLFRRHGLSIDEVKRLPLHGGSLRIYASKTPSGSTTAAPDEIVPDRSASSLDALLREEAAWVSDPEFYRGFGERVERLRADLLALLHRLKSEGKRIAVYGASAKGSTFLNYFGIGRETLDFVVDRSIIKQGHYTPGTHLPIYAPIKLLEDKPDYVLLLTWNFADEILEQQSEYRQVGGRFIVPIPKLRIV